MLSGEAKLVERCLQGDEAAWEWIVNSFGRRIYNLSYRYTGRREEAEDLTQEIFIKVYKNLKSFRSEAGNLQNWILRVGRNLIIDHCRKSRRHPIVMGTEEIEAMNLHDEKLPNPLRAAERLDASRYLRDGLQALAPELREAVVLRDLEGMAYEEIAGLLDVPEGTVKSRISRGRLELARILTKRRAQTGL